MAESNILKTRKIFFTLISMLAILTSCAAMAFAIPAIMLGPDIGAEKYFAKDEHYETFQVEVLELEFTDDTINFFANHNQSRYGSNMMIIYENAKVAFENGAKSILKNNMVVDVTVSHKYVGNHAAYDVVGLKVGDVELLPFETGKANLVAQLAEKSPRIAAILITTGSILAFLTISLVVCIVISKKKKVFYQS